MPLHVTIAINDRQIETLTIGRIDEFKGRDRWHEYTVVVDGDEEEQNAQFTHLYSQGARVCVLRALDALDRKRGTL